MNNMRQTLRSICSQRKNLRREIAIRDEVIHHLCYRWCIFNQQEPGAHGRADIFVDDLVARARAGTLKRDRDLLPPNVRLWHTLYAAYYATPGHVSMAKVPPLQDLPKEVAESAEYAARLVAQYWAAVPDFERWLEQREQVKLAPRKRTGRIRPTKGTD